MTDKLSDEDIRRIARAVITEGEWEVLRRARREYISEDQVARRMRAWVGGAPIAMTEPPRTLQNRLRNLTCDGYDGPHWRAQKDQAMHEAATALDAQSKLLAEAREALEPFANRLGDALKNSLQIELAKYRHEDIPATIRNIERAFRNARAVHAKLKAASGEG